jgi:hypothetical protein
MCIGRKSVSPEMVPKDEELDQISEPISARKSPEYEKSASAQSQESKVGDPFKEFLDDLQEKYFHNLQTMNNLMKEKQDLSSELNVTKKYLKHERKCNHLHRILRLSRESGDNCANVKDEGGWEDVESQVQWPPKYNENIDQSSSLKPKGSSTSPLPNKKQIRPQSADSGLSRKPKRHPSSASAVTSTERLQLEELEYQRDQAEYEAKKIKEQQHHDQLMKSLKRSYEEKPCLDWQRERQLKEERRKKSQERQKDHYQKWKLMNEQFTEFNEQQGPPPPGLGGAGHDPVPSSGDSHPAGDSRTLENVTIFLFLFSVLIPTSSLLDSSRKN